MSKKKTSIKKKKNLQPFDKYRYYLDSVQAPDIDSDFFRQSFEELKNKKPKVLREDFCGTFAVCCEWVKLNPEFVAYGIDLDTEPTEWGKKNNLPVLTPQQQSRITVLNKNVLDKDLPKADVIAAQNFSFFLFKKREDLKAYFKNCLETLNAGGILITDCFGGSGCYEPNEEETKFGDYSYIWDQDTYNPITHEAMFYIHYKRKGEKRRNKVFAYDWRLWSIMEIREIMEEVGFKKTHVYWEGTDKHGGGDGNFIATEAGDYAESWIAYIIGEK